MRLSAARLQGDPMRQVWKQLLAVLLLAALVGCSSSNDLDDSAPPDDTPGTGDGTAPPPSGPAPSAQTVELRTSAVTLGTAPGRSATLVATVKDDNNVLLSGIPVTFSTSSGALLVEQGETDNSGQARAQLFAGNDPSNRTVTVRARAAGSEEHLEVTFRGTDLQFIGGPSVLGSGATARYSARLIDSEGNGILGRTLEVQSQQGNPLSAATLATDNSGEVAFDLTAATGSGGRDTLTVSGLGLQRSMSVDISHDDFRFLEPESMAELAVNQNHPLRLRWSNQGSPVAGEDLTVSATRGDVPASVTTDADGEVEFVISAGTAGRSTVVVTSTSTGLRAERTFEFIGTDPDSIIVQAAPSVVSPNQSTTISAVVRDDAGNFVKNKTVEFRVEDKTAGWLSSPEATTDSFGRASTTYTAGAKSSGRNAVTVTARVQEAPSVADAVELTVGGSALRVTVGTGRHMESRDNETRYAVPWAVQVSDSHGHPVSGRDVEVGVWATHFATGHYVEVDGDWVVNDRQWCVNEDINRDGIRDDGEGEEGVPLRPGNPAMATPGKLVTDGNGFAQFELMYPKEFANWIRVEITVRILADGSEYEEVRYFELPALKSDLQASSGGPPGGIDSRFGRDPVCAGGTP